MDLGSLHPITITGWTRETLICYTPHAKNRILGLISLYEIRGFQHCGISCLETNISFSQPDHFFADELSCRSIFITHRFTRFASLVCLSCISFERFITIRKPFNGRIRKRFIRLTPAAACIVLICVLASIVLLSLNVVVDEEETSCMYIENDDWLILIARWINGLGFTTLLIFVTFNYGQIIRHVRRKFWQRKARVVAHANAVAKRPLVAEPRYLKDMTAAIIRIACFHVLCWLPFSIIQFIPTAWFTESVFMQLFDRHQKTDLMSWMMLVSEWLTYLGSALNWVFYYVINRDLRKYVRESMERRKRSHMSNTSFSFHKSLRRHMTQSFRFFYSINSYKSRENSMVDSLTTCRNGSLDSQNSPTLIARSVNNENTPSVEGLFGMRWAFLLNCCIQPLTFRDGRLHTYCSPRSSNGLSNGSINDCTPPTPAPSTNASRILTILQASPASSRQKSYPFLSGFLRFGANNSLQRFV